MAAQLIGALGGSVFLSMAQWRGSTIRLAPPAIPCKSEPQEADG